MNKELIDEAVDWWANSLTNIAEGVVGNNPFANELAQINAQEVYERKIRRFKASLSKRLDTHEQINCIVTDSLLPTILKDALFDAAIPESSCPKNVSMWFENGTITVSNGYGATPIVIFESQIQQQKSVKETVLDEIKNNSKKVF